MAGNKARRIIERDKRVVSPSLTREFEDFVFNSAKGCYVFDINGKRYLDFAGGMAVAGVGHNNPLVVKAIKKQLEKAIHCGFSDFYAEVPVQFIEHLLKFMPGMDKAFLSNSGTEAIEAAYKLARWHTNKQFCVAFKPSFHGRTMGSLSLTNSKPVHKQRFEPFLPVVHTPYAYCYRCPFGHMSKDTCGLKCLGALEHEIKKSEGKIAAVFMEPIAGESGYIIPPTEFIVGIRELCNKYNLLLCTDEIQAGCFRTGKFLAMENFGVKADIVAVGKAIGGGLPIGVTVSSNEIMDWVGGTHANTFGGNLLACSAGLAVLKFMKQNGLGENAKKVGTYMNKQLQEMQEQYSRIGDVRGIGLMIGIELVKDKSTKSYAKEERSKIIYNAMKSGLLLLPAGESTIRFCPPLTLTKQQADTGLIIFEDALKRFGV